MTAFYVVAGILGLALLMVVHEAGHLLAARAFGMRVVRFSIGFGPALFHHQAKGSETIYQVALIPFLAYVQIAGMNPFEEVDPDDKGSYANASLIGRITAIFAGPLANYLFASVLFFASFMIGGDQIATTTVELTEGPGPAKSAQMKNGDKIVAINGTTITSWDQLRGLIVKSANKPLQVEVLRGKERVPLSITPQLKDGEGRIGIKPVQKTIPVSFKEATVRAAVSPAKVVHGLVIGLSRILTGKEKPEFKGPVGIVKETSRAAETGSHVYLWWLGVLSAYLGGFNMLPIPALDGGRLMFLAYEAVTRRKPNARVEAHVHALGLIMLLALIAVVSVFDIKGN